jgi:hypothetical protein
MVEDFQTTLGHEGQKAEDGEEYVPWSM